MNYDDLMGWAADDATPKRDIFVRLQKVQGDADALLAIADGVLMRTDDNIVKGVLKAVVGLDSEHLAVSVEHAALLKRFDHVKTMLKELKIEPKHLGEAVEYVRTKDCVAADQLANQIFV